MPTLEIPAEFPTGFVLAVFIAKFTQLTIHGAVVNNAKTLLNEMKNEIKLTLAAEDFSKCYGIMILENGDYMIDVDQSKIPSDFLNRLKKWYEKYYPYTGMSVKELESKREHTEKLDEIGIELLNEIYKNGIFKSLNIDRYVYYSRGIDKPILELN